MNQLRSFVRQSAFTLLELIIVLLIAGILLVYVQSKFSTSSSYKQNTVIAQIISSAQLAQQLSMNDSERNFSLIIQSNQIDLQADGSSLIIGSFQFPIDIDSSVSISPVSTISFDSLGATNNLTLHVIAESILQVCFEASGYIHSC